MLPFTVFYECIHSNDGVVVVNTYMRLLSVMLLLRVFAVAKLPSLPTVLIVWLV